MNTRHQQTLAQIFRHPTSHNIEWRKVEHLFEALGAEIQLGHGARVKVILNGREASFSRPHHRKLDDTNEIVAIRKFLVSAGIAPDGHGET